MNTISDEIIESLHRRIQTREAIVGVVGLGYVGLPFAVEKAKVGFEVIGIENNPDRCQAINAGENYIDDVNDAELADLVHQDLLRAEVDFSSVPDMDIIIICVPTPLTDNLTPNTEHVQNVTKDIAPHLKAGQLISLESTTYPGTTDEVVQPILEEESGLTADEDFYLAHSPERVDPGNARYTTKNTNKVVGGVGPRSLEIAQTFYKQTLDEVVTVSSAKAAELVKVYENTFRAVNIALVNELALLCDKMDLDVWEVLEAAFTKPFGIMEFWPGPGVGGHCIPIDPHYLEWKAKEHNFETHFIALAGEVNRRMPEFVVEKARRVLNEDGIAPSQADILILGAAYKANVADTRESPALKVISELEADGAQVSYHDPFVPELKIDDESYSSIDLTPAKITEQDLVVVVTDHAQVDYQLVVDHAQAVLDTRNATRGLPGAQEGVTYL